MKVRHPTGCRGASERGFTLIELMVALMAGLFVAATAFTLARNASKFFRHEAGVSSAQFAAMMGMSRLQADLQRAGFLSSPNVQSDPLRCGDMADWPDGLALLASVAIEDGGSVTRHSTDHALSTLNGLSPDAIVLGGSFGTTEQFSVRAIVAGQNGGIDVFLQTDDGAMQRTLAAQNGGASLPQIFAAGRILRIVDDEGRQAYGVISAFDADASQPRISLTTAPVVPSKASTGVCGYTGMSIGTLVNPVVRVRYDLRAVPAATYPRYAGLDARARHDVQGQHQGEGTALRTELVRVEIDADDNEVPTSLEVLSEYAVDLKFGLTRAVPPVPPLTAPTLNRFAIGNAQVYAVAAGVSGGGGTPQRIRSVQVRLSTRAASADRDQAIPPPTGGGLFRFNLGVDPDHATHQLGYARVRSLVADVSLPNQSGVTW